MGIRISWSFWNSIRTTNDIDPICAFRTIRHPIYSKYTKLCCRSFSVRLSLGTSSSWAVPGPGFYDNNNWNDLYSVSNSRHRFNHDSHLAICRKGKEIIVKTMFSTQQLNSLRGDIYGGITAAIVALPLALAFGVASGVGAISGLYGAIAVGFFAAVFGGTRSQVSGPTGPMTVVMGAIVTTHADNLTEAFMVVFLAGFIQILFGLLKLGRFVVYTPHSVVSGFMSGIGAIIILIQIMPFFGLATVSGTPISSVLAWPTIFSSLNL